MATQPVKGTIGDQPVELNNAATETTLIAMLQQAKADSALLRAIAQKSKIDTDKINKAFEKQERQAESNIGGMTKMSNSSSLVGGFLMDMGASVMKTMGNIVQFGDQMLDGTAKVSDFYNAFKDLPLGLGLLATMLGKSVQFMEKNLEVNRQLQTVGVTLAGSLGQIRERAFSVGLSMDQMAQNFIKNSDVLARFGGTASESGKSFLNVNRILLKDFSSTLLGVGYRFEDLGNLAAAYVRSSGDAIQVTKNRAAEERRVAAATARYGEHLDFLARLTGESREAKEKELQEAQQEAGFQMYLASLDVKSREKANRAVQDAMVAGGKNGADYVKARMMGYAGAFSEGGIAMQSTMPGLVKNLEQMIRGFKDSNVSVEMFNKKSMKSMINGMIAGQKDLDGFLDTITAGSLGMGGLYDQIKPNIQALQNLRASGITTVEQYEKHIEEIKKAVEAEKKKTEAQIKAEQALKEMQYRLVVALTPVIERLATVAQQLATRFMNWVTNEGILDKVEFALRKVALFIETAFKDPEGTWNLVSGFFKELLAKFFGFFAESALGKMMFGNAAETLKRDAAVEKMRSVDPKFMENIAKALEHGDRVDPAELDKYQRNLRYLQEGRPALAETFRARAQEIQDKSPSEDAAKEYARQKNITLEQAREEFRIAVQNTNSMPKLYEQIKKQLEQQYQTQAKELRATADQIETGKIKDIAKLVPKYESGTAGSGPLIRDFGPNGQLALVGEKGPEAILNEQQLKNLVLGLTNVPQSSAQAGDMKLLATSVLALNKQQEATNRILERIADYNRRAMENGQSRFGNQFARV